MKFDNQTHECNCDRCRINKDSGRKIPVIPPLPERTEPYDPNPTVAICGECGLHIKRVMGYACMQSRCPIQPRSIC